MYHSWSNLVFPKFCLFDAPGSPKPKLTGHPFVFQPTALNDVSSPTGISLILGVVRVAQDDVVTLAQVSCFSPLYTVAVSACRYSVQLRNPCPSIARLGALLPWAEPKPKAAKQNRLSKATTPWVDLKLLNDLNFLNLLNLNSFGKRLREKLQIFFLFHESICLSFRNSQVGLEIHGLPTCELHCPKCPVAPPACEACPWLRSSCYTAMPHWC